jgi:threonyl-tRNA synthetase
MAEGKVSVRKHGDGDVCEMTLQEFSELLIKEITV